MKEHFMNYLSGSSPNAKAVSVRFCWGAATCGIPGSSLGPRHLHILQCKSTPCKDMVW